jgi:hypothetical protein
MRVPGRNAPIDEVPSEIRRNPQRFIAKFHLRTFEFRASLCKKIFPCFYEPIISFILQHPPIMTPFGGGLAFRHLKRHQDRAIGKQPLSNAKRYRIYHQPERIDQIMPDKRLNEIPTSPNVQIRPWLSLDFGDFFCNISA